MGRADPRRTLRRRLVARDSVHDGQELIMFESAGVTERSMTQNMNLNVEILYITIQEWCLYIFLVLFSANKLQGTMFAPFYRP